MMPTRASIVLLALTLSAPARAADEGKFYPPQGWAVARQQNGSIAVQAPDVPTGKTCMVLIMPDAEGEVNGAFAVGWKLMTQELKVVSGGEVRAGRSIAEYETRSTTAVVDAADTGRAYMHMFAVQVGPRVRRALFLSDDKAQFDKHLPTVKAMLDSVGVDPATAKAKRETLRTEPTGFEGVFYRGAVEFEPAGNRGQRAARVEYLSLDPAGRAYNGRPSGGPAACFDADDTRSPSYGRYTLRGDDVIITWNFDRTLNRQHTQRLKRRADGKLEQDGGQLFHRLEPCDGLKLDGTYAITWADGTKSRVRFTKDGRFDEQGLKHCVSLDNLVYPDWPKLPEAGTGTYTIARNTLEVKYEPDGPSRRMFFSTPDNPTDPGRIARISVANNLLEREP